TADSQRIVSASRDGTARVWDAKSRLPLAALDGHAGWVNGCAVTADGRHVVSASEDRTLKIWDLAGERPPETLEDRGGAVSACAVSADGRRVISASEHGTLKVGDRDRKRVIATTTEHHAGSVYACAVTADGRRVVSASNDWTLRVWDVETGRRLTVMEGHAGSVYACAVTPDAQRVVSASHDMTLKVWDIETGSLLATLEGHTNPVYACAVTADGRQVVSASHDGALRIWDLESGRALFDLVEHTSSVLACAATTDRRWVVSASNDRTLRVWDLDVRACVYTHRGDAAYTAVATCATTVVAGDEGGTIWILNWPPSAVHANRTSSHDAHYLHTSQLSHKILSRRPLMENMTFASLMLEARRLESLGQLVEAANCFVLAHAAAATSQERAEALLCAARVELQRRDLLTAEQYLKTVRALGIVDAGTTTAFAIVDARRLRFSNQLPKAREILRTISAPVDPILLAELAFEQAAIESDHSVRRLGLQRAFELYVAAGEAVAATRTLLALGHSEVEAGKLEEARRHFE